MPPEGYLFAIAIVGMAFRFPSNVHDETGIWGTLKTGTCGIPRIPDERWPVDELNLTATRDSNDAYL